VLDVRILSLCAALAAGLLVGGASDTPARAQGAPVVVIDVSYIFKHHVRFKEAQDAMKKEVEQYEESIRIERENITKMAESLKAFAPESPTTSGRKRSSPRRPASCSSTPPGPARTFSPARRSSITTPTRK
jgi:Skp family chaperone for outer membrane proteins